MGWFEFPVCCPMCGEPQSISPRWTAKNLLKTFTELTLSILLYYFIQDGSGNGWFTRSFRCQYCRRVFDAMPNEAYRKQRSTTRCPTCDYSLIGNKTGICPECGNVVDLL